MSRCRVCVTLSCCWKSLQVWFRWNTVTRCCWCQRSKDLCCSALKKRRFSSWAPNLARGECVCRMSRMICRVRSNTCSPSLFVAAKPGLFLLSVFRCFILCGMLISVVLWWCVQQWQVWSVLPARSLQTERPRGVCCPTWTPTVEI